MFMFISFVTFILGGWFCCFGCAYFIMSDLVYFIDRNIVTLNGRSVIMNFLFDWMSLLFMGFGVCLTLNDPDLQAAHFTTK